MAAKTAPIAEAERFTLAYWIMAHEARILLMAGREDDGLAVARQMPHGVFGLNLPLRLIADGGTRFLLAKRDLAGARRWSATLNQAPLFPASLTSFGVALALTWDEALSAAPSPDWFYDRALASGLDLLSADRLVELSRKPGLSLRIRRAMLSAAWLRFYILGRDADFRALFPEIRATLPELEADLNDVERAWTPWTRRHRITHMLLRFPGLSPRLLWSRPGPINSERDAGKTLSYVDVSNLSDGNWWCPIDPVRAQRDFFAQTFAAPLSSLFRAEPTNMKSLVVTTGDADPSLDTLNALAHDWLAWHPLFKEADLPELTRLSQAPSGPARLSQEAVAWAQESFWFTRWLGLDRGLPETLALAVRSTRYGCRRAGPLGRVSHAAWKALHSLYPKSEAAARTPRWFNEHQIY